MVLPFPSPAGFPIETTKSGRRAWIKHPLRPPKVTHTPHISIDSLPQKYYNRVWCSKNTVVWDGGIVLHGGAGRCELPAPCLYALVASHIIIMQSGLDCKIPIAIMPSFMSIFYKITLLVRSRIWRVILLFFQAPAGVLTKSARKSSFLAYEVQLGTLSCILPLPGRRT